MPTQATISPSELPPTFPQQADGLLRIGFAHPLQQRVQVRAAQHRAGEQREQFGLLRCAPGFSGTAGRAVDQRGDRHGHQQQHHDRHGAVGVGDREGCTAGRRGNSSAAGRTAAPTAPPGRHRRAARRPARRRRRSRSRRRSRGTGRAPGRSPRRSPTAPQGRQARTPRVAVGARPTPSRSHGAPARGSPCARRSSPTAARSLAPMPSSKMRAHRDRREVPITSWVAFSRGRNPAGRWARRRRPRCAGWRPG